MQDTIELAYKGSTYRLDDILVDKFCPSDLIEPGTAPLLLEQQSNGVRFTPAAEELLRQCPDLQVGVALYHPGKVWCVLLMATLARPATYWLTDQPPFTKTVTTSIASLRAFEGL